MMLKGKYGIGWVERATGAEHDCRIVHRDLWLASRLNWSEDKRGWSREIPFHNGNDFGGRRGINPRYFS